jgi:AbiV family abortive infection protein
MITSEIFRMAAGAALANADELCTEAQLLAEHQHNSRAAALAVIGLEEFAKAVAYVLAAIFHEQSDRIRQRLLNHDVKHWIADTFDCALEE